MYAIVLSILQLAALLILAVGVAPAQQARRGTEPNNDTQPPRCITEATFEITAQPPVIIAGQSTEVRWHVTLPDNCAAVRIRLDGEDVARNGSRTVTPLRPTSYNLNISQHRAGSFAALNAYAHVNVDYPDRVVIGPETPSPVDVLIGALQTNPVVIEFCVDLDLTGLSLEIGDDTTLIAGPGCARGPLRRGPRIFSTRESERAVFVLRGDRILFSGFQFEGPTPYIGDREANRERGIQIQPFDSVCRFNEAGVEVCEPVPIRDIEICNMEIFHWSGAAIEVMDNTSVAERGRLFNTMPNAVRIRNNYIHHNRHFNGYGYGVAVTNGAYALIEHNAFNENRHAIMGNAWDGKKDFSGYTARENLILADGGLHCRGWIPDAAVCWQTHQIDMHGTESTLFGGAGCCGIAGETILIERNSILYTAGYAIKIRGNPADKAVVDGNIFKHGDREGAIAQNGNPGWGDNITNPIDVRPNNVFGANTLDRLGTCDFDGYGNPDRFMATGVTWWAQSAKTENWRYLNTMIETLSTLQLGDFDNDGRCDVGKGPANPAVPPGKYSKDGTGPWIPVIAGNEPIRSPIRSRPSPKK